MTDSEITAEDHATWEGPFTYEEFWARTIEYWYEEEGIPETFPEPTEEEVAYLAAVARNRPIGIDISLTHMREALSFSTWGRELLQTIRAWYEIDGGNPGLDTVEREILTSILAEYITGQRGVNWPCNGDSVEYHYAFLKEMRAGADRKIGIRLNWGQV